MMRANSGNTPKLIVIVGFMGAGKTTVAREFARLLNCRAVDLDELITERERRTPAEIIEQSGEEEFRRIETETLRQVLNEISGAGEKCIVALGGGAWTIPENRELIAQHAGSTVWLNAPFELCWKRIQDGTVGRPLAASREVAERLFVTRLPIYEIAQIKLAVLENRNVMEIASMVASALAERTKN